MLAALIPQLRKADCLIPRSRGRGAGHAPGDPIPMFPAPVSRAPREVERREA
jgi:hypothetical protein